MTHFWRSVIIKSRQSEIHLPGLYPYSLNQGLRAEVERKNRRLGVLRRRDEQKVKIPHEIHLWIHQTTSSFVLLFSFMPICTWLRCILLTASPPSPSTTADASTMPCSSLLLLNDVNPHLRFFPPPPLSSHLYPSLVVVGRQGNQLSEGINC